MLSTATIDRCLIETLEHWLGSNAPDVWYSVAELANPMRAHGDPIVAIAIEGLDRVSAEAIRTELVQLGGWDLAEAPERLHLTTY